MPKAAVIIVNYNGKKYLKELFASLDKTVYPPGDWQIFFIDNGSGDDSYFWAKKHYPHFNFIENQKNLGFAEGNNVGIRKALEQRFDYLVLLNQDMTVNPDWLIESVKKAESNNQIGALQSLILLYDQPHLINTNGNQLHYLGFGWVGNWKLEIGNCLKIENWKLEIGYASGAAVLYRVDALRQVGLLDKKFFLYHEDLDLSWRLRLAGYKIVLAPNSKVYHKYEFSRNKTKFYFSERNRLICFFANYSLSTIILFLPAFIFTETAMLLYALFFNFLTDKIKGYWWILRHLSYIRQKRRQVQSLRKISDKEIIKHITSNFNFQEMNHIFVRMASFLLERYFKVVKIFIK